jgi:pimeloyl-ACP methyl ester carboxylesterase
MWRWLWLIAACHAAGGGEPAPDAAPPGELRQITYDGDSEWIYIAHGPPGAPIVVIAHGQGTEHVVNCWPDEVPHDATVKQAVGLADHLAAEGFTAVAIMYRNEGMGQPALPALRIRDTYLHDAAAVLAAARAVRTGDEPVAFVGHSNGTYAAWWAATDRPELATPRAGLDIRTVILAGHTANALANLVSARALFVGSDKLSHQEAITGGVLLAVGSAITAAHANELAAKNLDDGSPVSIHLAPLLSQKGIDAFRAAFVTPVPTAQGACRAGVPATCDGGCLQAQFAAGTDPGVATDYLSHVVVDAINVWNPDAPTDPGAATNSIVAVGREISPPFFAGHLLAPRALVLYSAKDHVIVPHGQATRDFTLAALRTQGATVGVPAIASDAHGVCEHGDYWDPSRSCGYTEIVAELHAALD